MDVQEQIEKYISSQSEPKRHEMQTLHALTLQVLPTCQLWFNDGKNSEEKTYKEKLGKASVTGYCIKFKTLKDINMDVLEAAIRDGFGKKA